MPKQSTSHLRIGKRYRPHRIDQRYDVIVIGSGPSGLASAAFLSKMGKKVAVLEQHYTAGGFTHAYGRNGYEWDVGVHFINDVAQPDHFLRKLFDFITNKKLQWRTLPEEKIFLDYNDGKQTTITGIAAKDRAMLKTSFPQEADNIDAIYQHAEKTQKNAMLFVMALKLSGTGLFGQALAKLARALMPKDVFRDAEAVIRRFTSNEELIAILCSIWPAMGITPNRHSYFMLAAFQTNTNRMSFPVGGSVEIAKTIIPIIQQAGGEVYTFADVRSIVVESGRANGVAMADGHVIHADTVISSAGVFNTFGKLLPEHISRKKGYLKKLSRVKRTVSHFNLYLGFNDSNENLNLHASEHFLFNSRDFARDADNFSQDLNAPLPFAYLSFPSAKDPTWNERYPNKATCSIFIYLENFAHFEKWNGSYWGKRGDDYEQLKATIQNRVLELMYSRYPQLRGKVNFAELSTPLSTQHFCNWEEGEIYGIDHDVNRFQQTWLQPTTKIPGLYLTGQDVLALGHTGAVLSGFLTTWKVLGWRQFKQLRKQIRDF